MIVRFLTERRRLLVVLSEDCDSCPLDWENISEACEIGEQGDLKVGLCVRIASTLREECIPQTTSKVA